MSGFTYLGLNKKAAVPLIQGKRSNSTRQDKRLNHQSSSIRYPLDPMVKEDINEHHESFFIEEDQNESVGNIIHTSFVKDTVVALSGKKQSEVSLISLDEVYDKKSKKMKVEKKEQIGDEL